MNYLESRDPQLRPYFSICIPQYNRTQFLIEACRSLASQAFRNFEICISDDLSTDERESDLLGYLKDSGVNFIYCKRDVNGRYDANLRSSISLSRGKYCFLLGNDDALNGTLSLEFIYREIEKHGDVGVVITNYQDYREGTVTRRVKESKLAGTGPEIAAAYYRDVSFVSGVILSGERARYLSTDKWDGSEMYQMYLMSRIVAEGGKLLCLGDVIIRKDIYIPGERVDSYAEKPRMLPCPIVERKHTFHYIGQLVVDAIAPFCDDRNKYEIIESVLRQLVLFTYPFWLFEFRRVQSWNYAMGICLGMRPRNFIGEMDLVWWRRWRLTLLYFAVSLFGLTLPVRLFNSLYKPLHKLAKLR